VQCRRVCLRGKAEIVQGRSRTAGVQRVWEVVCCKDIEGRVLKRGIVDGVVVVNSGHYGGGRDWRKSGRRLCCKAEGTAAFSG
jgi:hypothetical protein